MIRVLAGGRLVAAQRNLVSRFALIGLVLSGCFYTDPINQRPSVDIVQSEPLAHFRGDTASLYATGSDPEGSPLAYQWRAYACTDAALGPEGGDAGCDTVPFKTDVLQSTSFKVPTVRANGTPVQSVLVYLEAKDDLDATAKPIQQLVISLGDKPPMLTASTPYRRSYVKNIPIDLFAAVGDPDDGIMPPPALTWTVFSPMTQPAYTLVDLPNVPPDPAHPELAQSGKVFTPSDVGSWDIQVVATDALGMTDTKDIPLDVSVDTPPCLQQLAPIVPPAGQTYPLDQATQFSVLVVDDDLDVYPPSGDPVQGVTQFAWTVLPPGGSQRLPISSANHALLDPASYVPGDILELRVEIQDRTNTAVSCPDAQATCAVLISRPTCLQRQTWRVEVR